MNKPIFESWSDKTVAEYVTEARKDNRFFAYGSEIGEFETKVFTIKDVGYADVNGHQKEALMFEGEEKIFVFGADNRKRLFRMLKGEKMSDWIGKKVALYGEPNIQLKGQRVGGIVVRKANG